MSIKLHSLIPLNKCPKNATVNATVNATFRAKKLSCEACKALGSFKKTCLLNVTYTQKK